MSGKNGRFQQERADKAGRGPVIAPRKGVGKQLGNQFKTLKNPKKEKRTGAPRKRQISEED